MFNNELDKACFQHDMAYGGFKDLTTRTASDKILPVKHLILLQNMMDVKEGLFQWSIRFLIKTLLLHLNGQTP